MNERPVDPLARSPGGAGNTEDAGGDGRTRAALLAGLAEGAVLALPVQVAFAGAETGPGTVALFVLGFVPAFAAGVVWLRRASHDRGSAATAGLAVAIVAALAAPGSLSRAVYAAAIGLVVTALAASLAFRDWREPLWGAIAWCGLGIGAEAALSIGGGLATWRAPLALLIPTFVVSAFAARATTVWNEEGAPRTDGLPWLRRSSRLLAGLTMTAVIAAVLALRNGALERLGAIATPIVAAVVAFVVDVVTFLLQPVFWLADQVHLDPEVMRRLGANFHRRVAEARTDTGGSPLARTIGRFIGLAIVVLVAWLAWNGLRRVRVRTAAVRDTTSVGSATSTALPSGPEGGRRRSRGQRLPADRVRRWYAQMLLALDRAGIRKDPSTTPSEFVPQVADAFPAIADGFATLTGAYEDVRYGSLRLSGADLRELARAHRAMVRGVSAGRRAEPRVG